MQCLDAQTWARSWTEVVDSPNFSRSNRSTNACLGTCTGINGVAAPWNKSARVVLQSILYQIPLAMTSTTNDLLTCPSPRRSAYLVVFSFFFFFQFRTFCLPASELSYSMIEYTQSTPPFSEQAIVGHGITHGTTSGPRERANHHRRIHPSDISIPSSR